MKNTHILFISSLLLLSACRKDRVCTCTNSTISIADNGSPIQVFKATQTETHNLKKVTKKSAHCKSFKRIESYTQNVNGQPHVYEVTSQSDCVLK